MNKLTFALFTIGVLLITYLIWVGTGYESPKDHKSMPAPTHPEVVGGDPIVNPKPLNPDKKMTSDKSDDKTKAEMDAELKKEYEQNIKK
ncbi:MAG TPA: hypothetical protein VES38_10480 [Methylotenera sp.]|nr:hypothetical protein [Methylotenera sp.]